MTMLKAMALACLGALAQPALAQTGPAEQPPSGFAGRQYVDSTGCVFLRADLNGSVLWVPQVTADRRPVCGRAPTVEMIAADKAEVTVAQAAPPPANVPRMRAVVRAPMMLTATGEIYVPPGYQPAWTDGRLNPYRGPRTAEGDAEMARYFKAGRVPMVAP